MNSWVRLPRCSSVTHSDRDAEDDLNLKQRYGQELSHDGTCIKDLLNRLRATARAGVRFCMVALHWTTDDARRTFSLSVQKSNPWREEMARGLALACLALVVANCAAAMRPLVANRLCPGFPECKCPAGRFLSNCTLPCVGISEKDVAKTAGVLPHSEEGAENFLKTAPVC